MRLRIAVLLSLALAAPARAEKLARGMELRAPEHARQVELVRGAVHVSLSGGGRDLIIGVQLDVDRTHERVTLAFDGNCGGGDTQHYTYDELEAMLEAEGPARACWRRTRAAPRSAMRRRSRSIRRTSTIRSSSRSR